MPKSPFSSILRLDISRKLKSTFQHHFLNQDYQFLFQNILGIFNLAKRAVEEGFTHFIAVGGDGTLNEIVNGLIEAFPQKMAMIGKGFLR